MTLQDKMTTVHYAPRFAVERTGRFAVEGPGLADFAFPADQALLVVGDVHGQAGHLEALLAELGRTRTPGKTRHLVFLGDLVDRGPETLRAVRLAADAAVTVGADRVTWLPGNHELMLLGALRGNALDTRTWFVNGGLAVLDEVERELGEKVDTETALAALKDLLPAAWLEAVATGPVAYAPADAAVLLVHAGISPKRPLAETLGLTREEHLLAANERHWAWIRAPFLAWQGGFFDEGTRALGKEGRKTAKGRLVFHGHTPALNPDRGMADMDDPAVLRKIFDRTRTNARVCLDGGAAFGAGVAGAVLTDEGLELFLARKNFLG